MKKKPGRPRKPPEEKIQRTSISLPPEIMAFLKSRKHQSEYVESLIADDMTRKGIV